MFETFSKLYQYYGLEILAGISVIIIIILFFYNYFAGKEGNYTKVKLVESYPQHNEKNLNSSIESKGFTSKLESKAKIILEYIFKRPFSRVRPNFLNNPITGQNLEIDLYNEELKLGVEINGNQHYSFTPYF